MSKTDIVDRLTDDANRWMSGDVGRDNEEAGMLSQEAADTITRLRKERDAFKELIEICKDHNYNPFEPDNQSRFYHRLVAALTPDKEE